MHRVLQVRPVLWGRRVQLDQQENKAQQDPPDHWDLQDHRERKAYKAKLDPVDQQVRREKLDPPDPA